MMNIKINKILELLYKVYAEFNKELFENKLPKCIITLGYNRGKKEVKTLGRTYINLKWLDNETGEINYAIDITPLAINEGFHEVISTLLHEMVHIYCLANDIKDCTKGGKHKNEFKTVAESIGLTVENDDTMGWAVTYLSDKHYNIISNIDYDKSIFDIDCLVEPVEEKKSTKEKKPKYKHYCPNNHNKPFKLPDRQVNLKCSICNANFIIEEQFPEAK
ncbi:SprT-like domain-containing protein (plasmid) [Clostridium perfringens]